MFNHDMKKGRINNPAGYFISLAKLAKKDELTVPGEAIVNVPKSAEALAADKEKQERIELWSEFIWLRDHAEREQVDMQALAAQMGDKTEAAYAMFYQTQ